MGGSGQKKVPWLCDNSVFPEKSLTSLSPVFLISKMKITWQIQSPRMVGCVYNVMLFKKNKQKLAMTMTSMVRIWRSGTLCIAGLNGKWYSHCGSH